MGAATITVPAFYLKRESATLTRYRNERQQCVDFIERTLSEVEARATADGKGDLSKTEQESLQRQKDRITELDAQIKPLADFEALSEVANDTVRSYSRAGQTQQHGDDKGEQRSLGVTRTRAYEYRSAGELLADAWRAKNRHDRTAQGRLESAGLELRDGFLVRAAEPHNTTDEIPGLLPKQIVGEIINNVDAARPFISSVGAKDLGGIPGTSFDRPTITQHVEVGKQAAQKTEVANRQFIVGSVPFTKDTYGGWANVSRQSIDWSSPGVWEALMTDFIEQYAIATENAASGAFATAVTQTVELGTVDTAGYVKALYEAAALAYQGSGRLPDTIWTSLDQWVQLGSMIDTLKGTSAGDGAGNTSGIGSFAGNMLRTDRVVVPGLPAGTIIVGVKNRTEVYEDRFGFLSAVEPKVFGVELAYGGYMASGTVKPAAFAKIVNVTP